MYSRQVDGGEHEGLLEVRSQKGRGPQSGHQEDVPDVDQGGTSEGEVSPLIRGDDQRSDETGDDHDEIEEDKGHDVGEGETGREDEGEEEGGGGDDPWKCIAGRLSARNCNDKLVPYLQSMYLTYQI